MPKRNGFSSVVYTGTYAKTEDFLEQAGGVRLNIVGTPWRNSCGCPGGAHGRLDDDQGGL